MLAQMRCNKPKVQVGFSLIEVMVSMTLGVIILYSVSEIFVNNNRVRGELERGSRQIENGRYAVQLLVDELSNAGYFGEAGAQTFPAVLPPVCLAGEAEITDSLGVPIFGDSEVSTGSVPNCLDGFKGGGSYIAVRRSSTCNAFDAACSDTYDVNRFHVQVSACQESNPGGVFIGKSGLDNKDRTCIDVAPVYRYLNRIYYVNDESQLVRAELNGDVYGDPTRLVDGVEQLHFEYGIDREGTAVGSPPDGVPDEFVSEVPTQTDWGDVVSVRIWVLARNAQPTPGYEDGNTYSLGGRVINASDLPSGFKRQVYSSTVRLNNIAGRRETS